MLTTYEVKASALEPHKNPRRITPETVWIDLVNPKREEESKIERALKLEVPTREEQQENPLRAVVQKYKYGRKIALGKPLGRLLARGCAEFLSEFRADFIVPVPLHPKRLRWRGFNQSLLLARQVGRAYGLPVDPFLLRRNRDTVAQTQLPEEQRVALELKHLQDCSVEAISQHLGRSKQAVGGLLYRGLKRLRELLDESG